MDSVFSFHIKKCPPIRKAVFELVKKLVEWRVTDAWDEENNWLLEGRTVLIYKGGDRKDPANYRPITCLPTNHQDGDPGHSQKNAAIPLWRW